MGEFETPSSFRHQRVLFLHFYKCLDFHSKNARDVFRTYSFTYVQIMKPVEVILREKFEMDERQHQASALAYQMRPKSM